MELAVNSRVTAFAMGGQQRVTAEIIKRLGPIEAIAPDVPLGGVKGHLWEQCVLPLRAGGKLLWSPSATGPIAYRRQVVTLHDVAFFDVPEFFAANFTRLYSALIPRLAHRVAKIVTVSEFSRERIAKTVQIDPARIEVIPNGVTENFREYSQEDIARTGEKLGLPKRYLLLQATSDRRKNLHRALEAWKVAQARMPEDVTLVVSGNLARAHVFGDVGPIENAPKAKLLGFVDEEDIGPLMAGAEAFLFPSIYEGFGLPIVEAMACGAPVLTAKASATQEIAGNAALLVDPFDVQDIANGMVHLVEQEELRRTLKAAGLVRAARYNWDEAAARYRALFETL